MLRVAPHPQYLNQQQYAHQPYHPMQAITGRVQPSPFAATHARGTDSFDRVIPSIEPHGPVSAHERDAYRILTQDVGPMTVEQFHERDRRALEHTPPPPPDQFRPLHGYNQWLPPPPSRANEVIDLTTPERQSRSENPSPMRDVQPAPAQYGERGQHAQDRRAFSGTALHDRPPLMQSQVLEPSSGRRYQTVIDPVPYDPRQPMLLLPERDRYVPQYNVAYPVTPQPIHGAPAPVQQMPLDGRR